MKSLILFLIFSIYLNASADVLEKIRFEDAAESRIEHGLAAFDKNIRVNVSVGYKKYESMPGTTLEDLDQTSPFKIDEQDIAKIFIEVSTSLETVPDDMKSKVYKLLPINRNRMVVKFNYTPEIKPTPIDTIKAKDISEITTQVAAKAGEFLSLLVASGISVLFLLAFFMHYRSLKMFRSQFENLSRVISESHLAPPQMNAPQNLASSKNSGLQSTDATTSDSFNDLSHNSIKELMADCYWCSKDNYACWLWKNLNSPQKKMLLDDLGYMKDYAQFFLELEAIPQQYHEHPYYINPLQLSTISQEDLNKIIIKNKTIWHLLSPIRQQGLQLPLSEKLQIVQKKPAGPGTDMAFNQKSTYRVFDDSGSWGQVSFDDESKIFSQPDMVPKQWQKNIHSLVWLSQREAAYISDVLAKHDARALASAWIGAPEVLAKLESCLPEKKLKLLKTYREKITPSQNSSCYQALVAAGFIDEAA